MCRCEPPQKQCAPSRHGFAPAVAFVFVRPVVARAFTSFAAVPIHPVLLALATVSCVLTTAAARGAVSDRRIVDTVIAGDAASEAAHGYDDADATRGIADGKPFRQTRGWMHFVLSTFDDTDVTLALTFAGGGRASVHDGSAYDLVVEDSVLRPRAGRAADSSETVVEVAVPARLTRGKTGIVVFIRARGGLTPPLHALRVIQDHHEVDLSSSPSGVVR
jgi:hypothetical protein